jgi:hypothetical protein
MTWSCKNFQLRLPAQDFRQAVIGVRKYIGTKSMWLNTVLTLQNHHDPWWPRALSTLYLRKKLLANADFSTERRFASVPRKD